MAEIEHGVFHQSAAAASSSSVNTLNKLYPSQAPELYPKPSDVQAANPPLPVRFANIDQVLAAARSTEEIPAAISQGETLAEAKANLLDAVRLVLQCQRELAEAGISPQAVRESFELVET